MIRGDTKDFNFKIKQGETYIDGSIYSEVEVQFNNQHYFQSLKKLKTNGEVEWINDHFKCYLSQEDTFKLNDGNVQVQVRLYIDGICKGTIVKSFNVGKVLSSEVLK